MTSHILGLERFITHKETFWEQDGYLRRFKMILQNRERRVVVSRWACPAGSRRTSFVWFEPPTCVKGGSTRGYLTSLPRCEAKEEEKRVRFKASSTPTSKMELHFLLEVPSKNIGLISNYMNCNRLSRRSNTEIGHKFSCKHITECKQI